MKTILTTTAIASSIALGLSGASVAMAQTPSVNVATDPSFVPFEMMDSETGEMIGFDMDIINAVAERAGFEVNLTTMEFSGIIPAVQTGSQEIAIAGTTITEERAQVVDFSDPYYDSGLQIHRSCQQRRHLFIGRPPGPDHRYQDRLDKLRLPPARAG